MPLHGETYGHAETSDHAPEQTFSASEAEAHARALALRAVAKQRLASISKDAVAVAIDTLIEAGMLVVDDVDPSTYRCAHVQQQQQQLQLAQQQSNDVNTEHYGHAEVGNDEIGVATNDGGQGGNAQKQDSQQFHHTMSQQQHVSALATPPSTPMAATAVHVHSHTAKTPTLMAARCVAPPTGVTPMVAPPPAHASSEVAPWSAGSAANAHVPQHVTPQPMQAQAQAQAQAQQQQALMDIEN